MVKVLVGYTNVGKSTLMNIISNPKARKQTICNIRYNSEESSSRSNSIFTQRYSWILKEITAPTCRIF